MLWSSSGRRSTTPLEKILRPEEDQSIWSKRRQGFQPCCEAGIREPTLLGPLLACYLDRHVENVWCSAVKRESGIFAFWLLCPLSKECSTFTYFILSFFGGGINCSMWRAPKADSHQSVSLNPLTVAFNLCPNEYLSLGQLLGPVEPIVQMTTIYLSLHISVSCSVE